MGHERVVETDVERAVIQNRHSGPANVAAMDVRVRVLDLSGEIADAGVSGGAQDFLDFANIAAFAINAFDAIPKASNTDDPDKGDD